MPRSRALLPGSLGGLSKVLRHALAALHDLLGLLLILLECGLEVLRGDLMHLCDRLASHKLARHRHVFLDATVHEIIQSFCAVAKLSKNDPFISASIAIIGFWAMGGMACRRRSITRDSFDCDIPRLR
jgi:hypothetical protein